MTATTVVILAGCNIDTDPMPPKLQADYQNELDALIRNEQRAGAVVLFRGHGEGEWNDGHFPTVYEETISYALVLPDAWAVELLRNKLSRIAKAFKQDGIGLVIHNHALYEESYVVP